MFTFPSLLGQSANLTATCRRLPHPTAWTGSADLEAEQAERGPGPVDGEAAERAGNPLDPLLMRLAHDWVDERDLADRLAKLFQVRQGVGVGADGGGNREVGREDAAMHSSPLSPPEATNQQPLAWVGM
jgi:hypothetical protein